MYYLRWQKRIGICGAMDTVAELVFLARVNGRSVRRLSSQSSLGDSIKLRKIHQTGASSVEF
jgi:hypothetical protein